MVRQETLLRTNQCVQHLQAPKHRHRTPAQNLRDTEPGFLYVLSEGNRRNRLHSAALRSRRKGI